MSSKELSIRAWKNPQYRASLSTEAGAVLPESPAGASGAKLGEAELGLAMGGAWVKAPTWKYIDGTPDWAIANALSMGYEVEHLG
jgi:mersacidin/lichenicidin family type 2 lantibiotic